MPGWIARIFFVIAGFITSLFVANNALQFPVVQMVIAVLLFTITVAIIAFWPTLVSKVKQLLKKR